MDTNARVGAAVAAGYLFGRFKKLRLALMVGTALASDDVRKTATNLVQHGTGGLATSAGGKLAGEASSRVVDAGRSAAIAAAATSLERLSDRLAERTAALQGRDPRASQDEGEEDVEDSDEYEDEGEEGVEDSDEYEDEGDEEAEDTDEYEDEDEDVEDSDEYEDEEDEDQEDLEDSDEYEDEGDEEAEDTDEYEDEDEGEDVEAADDRPTAGRGRGQRSSGPRARPRPRRARAQAPARAGSR